MHPDRLPLHWCKSGCIHLSAHDVELIKMVTTGAQTKHIAKQFRRSPYTVKNRLSRLYQRLGVQSRAELTVLAFRQGLIH